MHYACISSQIRFTQISPETLIYFFFQHLNSDACSSKEWPDGSSELQSKVLLIICSESIWPTTFFFLSLSFLDLRIFPTVKSFLLTSEICHLYFSNNEPVLLQSQTPGITFLLTSDLWRSLILKQCFKNLLILTAHVFCSLLYIFDGLFLFVCLFFHTDFFAGNSVKQSVNL